MDERGLGKQLQTARRAAGLTQQDLCQKANLSFSTLTKIERGAIRSPSIFTVIAIADAVGVSLDELTGRTPPLPRVLRKTKSGVSFVFFDVHGCLIYFYQRAFDRLAAMTGMRSDLIETAYWRYNDDVCRGVLSMSDFKSKLATHMELDELNWEEYYLDAVEPVTEMQELLVWAVDRYRVGLLTNIMPGLLSAMKREGIVPDLPYDVVVDSSEVGHIKPEPEIYAIAQERAGVPPEEILLIDDSRPNLMAADRLGWHVLWFDDSRAEESVARAREALEPAE